MIGISQVQFPSKSSSKIRVGLYFTSYYLLSALTIPTSVFSSILSSLFSKEIDTFLTYKRIKKDKITREEYRKIFIQGNIKKIFYILIVSSLLIYYLFSPLTILLSTLAPIPLAIALVLLQFETRPKTFNPIVVWKSALQLLSDGLYENLFGMRNIINALNDHMLPHLADKSIKQSINILNIKYGPTPEKIEESEEFIKFLDYLKNRDPEFISFIKEWCNNTDQVHSSQLTGGQILWLALKACNNDEHKKSELVNSVLYSINYAKGTSIPNTCFTGIVGAMLKSLEGFEEGIHVQYQTEDKFGLDSHEIASTFIINKLQNTKNYKEIINAWNKLDKSNEKIIENFIQTLTIELIRTLFYEGFSQRNILNLVENLDNINLHDIILKKVGINKYLENKIQTITSEELKNQIKEEFLFELINKDFMTKDFHIKVGYQTEVETLLKTMIERVTGQNKLNSAIFVENASTVNTSHEKT